MSLNYTLPNEINEWFNNHCVVNIDIIENNKPIYNINKSDNTFDDICQKQGLEKPIQNNTVDCCDNCHKQFDITSLINHLRSCVAIVKDRYFLKQEQDHDGSIYIEELTFEQLCKKLMPYHPFVNINDRINFAHVIVKYSHLFVYRKLKCLQNKEDINRECTNVVNTGNGTNVHYKHSCCGPCCPLPCCECKH